MAGPPPPSATTPLVFPAESDPLLEVRIRSRTKEPHLHHANVVLTALTDVLQSQGLTPSTPRAQVTTAYFGALMTSLDDAASHSADTLAGISHLLALIFPQLPPTILRAKAGDLAPVLLRLLSSHSDTAAVAKSTLTCIATLLSSLDPAASASTSLHSHFLHLFQALLVYSLDPRPKLRHLAQLRTSTLLRTHHSAHPHLPRTLMDTLQSFAEREVHSATGKEHLEVLFLCGLLQMVGETLTLSCRAFLLELLLTVPMKGQGQSVLFVQVMRTVVALTEEEVGVGAGEGKVDVKWVVMVDRLLTALVDYVPHPADIEANTAFSSTVTTVLTRLARAHPIKAGQQLLVYLDVYSGLLLSPKPTVVRIASQTLSRLLHAVVQAEWIQSAISEQSGEVQTLIKAAQSLLGYRYKAVWLQVFPVIASVFSSFPPTVIVHMKPTPMLDHLSPLLLLLDQLRATPDLSAFIPVIDDTIAASIAYHSTAATLQHLPLNLPTTALTPTEFTSALDSSRQWLLPLIRAHARGARLLDFWDAMWKEVVALRAAKARWEEESDAMRVRACELLEEAVWDTFPSFCSWADDVPALKSVAKRIGEWLGSDDCHYAQPLLCKGLTLLITQNQEVVTAKHTKPTAETDDADAAEAQRVFEEEDDDDDSKAPSPAQKPEKSTGPSATAKYPFDPSSVALETAQSNLSVLSVYAKNFLPLLFNLVSRSEPNKRDVLLECIEVYSAISDAATINSLFRRALKKLLEANAASVANTADAAEAERAHSLADIVLAMVASLDEDNLTFLYRSLIPQLSSADAITQKKAYKGLAAVCHHHPTYFGQRWQEVLAAVTAATPALLPSAGKVRLFCLTALCIPIPLLVVSHPQDAPGLLGQLPSLLGEVLLGLKDPSFKTRHAAYHFINQLGAAMREADARIISEGRAEEATTWGLTSTDLTHPLFSEYLVMLMAGLAGTSPHMQSATVMAFSHLLFSCRGSVPTSMTSSLLSTFLPLLSSKSREVQKSMMGLLKVVSLCLPAEELRVYATEMVQGLGRMGEVSRHRFQEKLRVILDILMRKIGVEEVRGMVGKDQLKLVEHIRKMTAREVKAKAEAWAKRKAEWGTKEEQADPAKLRKADFDSVLYGSDGEEEGEEEAKESKPDLRRGRRKERSRDAGFSVREGTEDLLSSDMRVNLAKAQPQQTAVDGEAERRKKKKKASEVRENAEGKLLVMEEDGGDDEGDREEKDMEEGEEGGVGARRSKKRGREQDEEGAGGRGEGGKRRMVAPAGSAYAGRGGAGGDAKRRGQKYDPYAFIPLDATVLNKRKQVSTRKKLEGMIGSSQRKGGAASAKRRAGGAGGGGGGGGGEGEQRRLYSKSKAHKQHKA